jgi:hypothetical protein
VVLEPALEQGFIAGGVEELRVFLEDLAEVAADALAGLRLLGHEGTSKLEKLSLS